MTYQIKLDIAVKIHPDSDVSEVLPSVEKIGLLECMPYTALNTIFGTFAVGAVERYDSLYEELSKIPDVISIETAVIKKADRDDC